MSRVLSKAVYQVILEEVSKLPYRNRVQRLHEKFPEISIGSIKCIVAQECQQRMKHSHGRLTTTEIVEDLYQRYNSSVANNEEPGILLRLSDELGLTPALLARVIVEKHYQKSGHSKPSKLLVSTLLKNTSLIDDRDLAFEVYVCLIEDNEYGPIAEATKQSLGYEYEIFLRMQLEERRITFLHEEHLRLKGYDKTPDIKLEIPVAVDGQVINWIESKALFGDEDVHRGYLQDQLYSYWNRFGPGLVIYWFGYVQGLEKIHQNRTILIRDELPKSMTLMEQDPR